MVRRLADYKWSSYRAYAYGKRAQDWLNTKTILSQFLNVDDPHRSYRENLRKYAKEEQRTWQDLRHGVFVGTEKFINKIKKRYLPDVPHAEMPSQRRLAKNINIETVISKAARLMKFDLELCRNSVRIPGWAKTDRDLLIYLVWQLGVATNPQIGEKFGLTYSAVSQRVRAIKEKLYKDKDLTARYKKIKSIIKI
jgi:hypothetical protein